MSVDDVEHGQCGFDQEEPLLRRSDRALVPSTRYLSSDYVQVTESGELDAFSEVKARAIG